MLMVDRVLSLDGLTGVAVKNISHAEPCFQGHFPDNPVFPGVLIIEALAQTCALCLNGDGRGKLPIFAGINSARFRRMVRPGDQLRLSVRGIGEKNGFYTFETVAETAEEIACEAELVVVLKK